MNRNRSLLFGGLTLATAFVTLAAGDPAINLAKSSIVATFKQENVPVNAPFKNFSGRIDYNPAQPTAAKATLTVDTGSLDLGDPDYNAEVKKKNWLDSTGFPKATYVSTSVTPAGAGKFNAVGTLSMKGKTQTLTVPVTVTQSGGVTLYDGTFEISRTFYNIGDPEWNDVVDDKVIVKFHFVE